MRNLVQVNYNDLAVTFTEDGWFNATEAASHFNKRPADWLENKETKEYIAVLSNMLEVPNLALLKVKRGGRGKSDATWLHPKLAVPFARWLETRFAVWCDLQIDGLLRGTHTHHDWKKLRHQAAASFKVMTDILQMTRQRLGKTCAPHHFSNESRLVNWALTGVFGKVDREGLGAGDLDLLAKLENLDTVLIGCGSDYDARKMELERFAGEQRVNHAPRLDTANIPERQPVTGNVIPMRGATI